MHNEAEAEILELTQRLLDCVTSADWDAYKELCDPGLTCFEPESRGCLVEGLNFHKFYFEQGGHMGEHRDTIIAPHVRFLEGGSAVVCYTRLVQRIDANGASSTDRFEETRVWERRSDDWKHVHFHRSNA